MDPAKISTWKRFYDEVVLHGGDWPRDLWFAAVADAIAAAEPEGSELSAAMRRDVAELQELERRGRGSYQDEQRIAQLEAQITALIGRADEAIRGAADLPVPGEAPLPEVADEAAVPAERRVGWRWGTVIGSAGLAVLLFGASLFTAVQLYEQRLQGQVAAELDGYVAEINASIGRIERDLAARLQEARAQGERMRQMQADLDERAAAFSAKMTETLDTMVSLREAAVADLERRLEDESGDVALVLERLEARAGALRRGLDEISEDLAGLERGLPDVSQSFVRLTGQIDQGQDALEEVSTQIAALKGMAPELQAVVAKEQDGLERQIADHRAALAGLGQQITALEEEIEASGAELAGFRETLQAGLEQARADGEGLRRSVAEIEDMREQVAQTAAAAEGDVASMKASMQQRIDAILSEMAEQADLAVMRGDDVLQRAEAQARREVESAGEQAVEALSRLREEEIAALARQVSATRTELEETRSGLISGWQRMDRRVADRHDELMSGLDTYAAAMEERVTEFLDAVNVMVAQSTRDER